MVDILEKKLCCGCSACAQICPKQCIHMEEDSEGFLYPRAGKDSCIDCKRCEHVCPVLASPDSDHAEESVSAFISYQNNECIRLASSSGGIFSVLAEKTIHNGGVVFGAAFDQNFMVHHIAVSNADDLCRLRGSKYMQSRVENTYAEAKKFLDSGVEVLFSGTACQIAGLKKFLRREYPNLFTVDVLCHGAPTPRLWKRYLDEKIREYGAPVRTVNFRGKMDGWKKYSVNITFENAREYKRSFFSDEYMRLFLSDICLRPSCHDCRFKSFPRVSDITLGDCWGVEKHSPEMDDDKGTSVVIINSRKGMAMKKEIAHSCTWKAADLDVVLPETADSRKSVAPHRNRKAFFDRLNQGRDVRNLQKMLEPSLKDRVKRKIHRIRARLFDVS